MDRGTRGVSSVMAVVLMVAVTVILAAAVGSFVLDIANVEQEPAPQVANANAELLVGAGSDQTVRITHEGGDTVDVSDLEIVVSFSGHSERSRLVGIPTRSIDAGDYEGDDIWNGGADGIGGELKSGDGEWSSGESISFRINDSKVNVNPGETVTVTVVHAPTNKVLLERRLTATTNALSFAPAFSDEGALSSELADSDSHAASSNPSTGDGARSSTSRGSSASQELPSQSSNSLRSHSATTSASRAWAVRVDILAG